MTEPDRHDGPDVYPAEKARQGRIVLHTRQRRLIFLGGLAGFVLLVLVLPLLLSAS